MAQSIVVEGLKVSRGTFTLHVERLEIMPREVFALVGRTGSGKTLLMESIAGAFPIDEGRILLDGVDARGIPVQKRHMGILYQDHSLFPHMTVRDNIAYGLRMHRVPKPEIKRRVDEQLELFGIAHIADRYPGIISGGESQRTALARALVLEPELLVLDEPFSALDPATKQQMYATLKEVHRRFDCTIVLVTHDFTEAIELADRVGILLDGSLREVVPAKDLLDATRYSDSEVLAFLGIEDAEEAGQSLQQA